MDRAELLRCMQDAADALAEFRYFVPIYCPEAVAHLEQALRHFDVALALCDRPGGSDDTGDGARSRLRITW